MVMGSVACLCPLPAISVGFCSAAVGTGKGEPGLPLTFWICPRPREKEEKEDNEEVARGLHGAAGKCAGARVAEGGRGHGSRDHTLLPRAALPGQRWRCQCHGEAPAANEDGAEVSGRAWLSVFPKGR